MDIRHCRDTTGYVCLLRHITEVYSTYDASILMLLSLYIRCISLNQNRVPYER